MILSVCILVMRILQDLLVVFIQNQSVDQCALKVLTTGSHLAAKQLGNFFTCFRDIVKVKVVLVHLFR